MGNPAAGRAARAERRSTSRDLPDFSALPERVAPQDLRSTQDVDPGPDPRGGRDSETEFMLRYAGS
jgi:hypothetical protein